MNEAAGGSAGKRARRRIPTSVPIALAVASLALHGAWSLTRHRQFTNDSMNYVDVARNIAAGHGIMQSTIGFNVPTCPAGPSTEQPLTAQAPLYPILIAAGHRSGLAETDAALAIPLLAYGVILLAAFGVMRTLYGDAPAWLATALLLASYPLRQVSAAAWTEAPAIALALLSIAAGLRARGSAPGEAARGAASALLSGLLGGLAFATRYAFLLAPALTTVLVALRRPWRVGMRDGLFHVAGSLLAAAAVLSRNVALVGAPLGPRFQPEPGLARRNLAKVWEYALGEHLSSRSELQQWVVLLSAAGLLLWGVYRQRRGWLGAARMLLSQGRFVLPLWACVYPVLAGLVLWMSVDSRLLAPATVFVELTWAGLFCAVVRPRPGAMASLVAVAALAHGALCAREFVRTAPANETLTVRSTPRLEWLRTHTTATDYIIGDDTVYVPFYFRRPAASFSPYPFTRRPTYEGLMGVAQDHCVQFERVLLVLRKLPLRDNEWRSLFGPFVADLAVGSFEAYPALEPLANLPDAWVFRMRCAARPSG
jgi:4-amino-4-deoxy-L-arabinose transferase-like glycosyltransferase